MKQVRRKLYTSLGGLGLLFGLGGTCLPENYIALTARNISLSVADSLVGILTAPFFSNLGVDDGTTVDTTDTGSTASTGDTDG